MVLACVIAMAATIGLQGDDSALEAIVGAYRANQAILSRHATVRYAICDGIVEGGLTVERRDLGESAWERQMTGDGILLLDGPRLLSTQIFPVSEVAKWSTRTSPKSYRSYSSSIRILSDGNTAIHDRMGILAEWIDGESASANHLHTADMDDAVRVESYLPDSLYVIGTVHPNGLDAGSLLGEVAGSEWMHVSEIAPVPDSALVRIKIEMRDGGSVVYVVDMRRGALPVRVEATDPKGGLPYLYLLDDIREVSDGGWFPFRVRRFTEFRQYGQGIPDHFHVWEMTVNSAEFAHAPPRSEFQLEFPKPVPLYHATLQARVGVRQVWDLDAIRPAALPRKRSQPVQEFIPDPVMAGPVSGSSWLTSSLLIGGAALSGLALFWIIRRR